MRGDSAASAVQSRLDSALAEVASLGWRIGFISEDDSGLWTCNLRRGEVGRLGLAVTCLGRGSTCADAVEEAILDIPYAVNAVATVEYTLQPALDITTAIAAMFQPAQPMKRKV